jgi:hypothetical protein
MTEALETAATEAPAAEPTIEQIAAQIFGEDAPVATEEAKPAEVVPDVPKPDPVAEKVSARLEIAKRAELRAAASRAELASAKAEVDAQRAEVAEKAKAVDAFMAAKLSPSKALELLGMSPKEFLESLATEHEPAAVAARAVAGTKSEVDELRAELKAMRDAALERERATQRQEADHGFNAATTQFLEFVDAAPEKYPHLIAEYTPAELAAAARETASTHSKPYFDKFGEYPSDDIIAQHLEDQAATRVQSLAERRARIGKPASAPSQGNSSGVLQVTQPEKGPSPRTLTSRAASEKASAPARQTQEDLDAECVRILQAGLTG